MNLPNKYLSSKHGINPITICPAEGSPWAKSPYAVLARLGVTGHSVVKLMAVPRDVTEENAAEKMANVPVAIIDETRFIEAIGYLFPRGELSNCHLVGGDRAAAVGEVQRYLQRGSPAAAAMRIDPAAETAPVALTVMKCAVGLAIHPYDARFMKAAPSLAASAPTLGALTLELQETPAASALVLFAEFSDPTTMALRLPTVMAAAQSALAAIAADSETKPK